MTGLRTIWGISLNKIEEDYGIDFKNHVMTSSKKSIEEKLISVSKDIIKTTQKGKFLIDGIASDLFMI